MTLKPIETHYNGYHFRSRLEARWAVFFDVLGIPYQYEPQGFEINSFSEGEGPWPYLPDFFLPTLGTWVEVKGTLDGLSDDYWKMLAWAVDWGGHLPGMAESYGSTKGLLWLGPVPDLFICRDSAPAHPILQHSKGGWVNFGVFCEPSRFEVIDLGENFFDASGGGEETVKKTIADSVHSPQGQWCFTKRRCPPRVFEAYNRARTARFEHGRSGN